MLNNAREAVFNKAFQGESPTANSINQTFKELTRTIIHEVRRLPGNRICGDCGAPGDHFDQVLLDLVYTIPGCRLLQILNGSRSTWVF